MCARARCSRELRPCALPREEGDAADRRAPGELEKKKRKDCLGWARSGVGRRKKKTENGPAQKRGKISALLINKSRNQKG